MELCTADYDALDLGNLLPVVTTWFEMPMSVRQRPSSQK